MYQSLLFRKVTLKFRARAHTKKAQKTSNYSPDQQLIPITGTPKTQSFSCKACRKQNFPLAGFEIPVKFFILNSSVIDGLATYCPEGVGNCYCSDVAFELKRSPDAATRDLGIKLEKSVENGLSPENCGDIGGGKATILDYEQLDIKSALLDERTKALEEELNLE
eukprot:gene4471-7852_t